MSDRAAFPSRGRAGHTLIFYDAPPDFVGNACLSTAAILFAV